MFSGKLLEDRRVLATVTWDGEGQTSAWNDAVNWPNNELPTATDDVVIDIAGATVTLEEFIST